MSLCIPERCQHTDAGQGETLRVDHAQHRMPVTHSRLLLHRICLNLHHVGAIHATADPVCGRIPNPISDHLLSPVSDCIPNCILSLIRNHIPTLILIPVLL